MDADEEYTVVADANVLEMFVCENNVVALKKSGEKGKQEEVKKPKKIEEDKIILARLCSGVSTEFDNFIGKQFVDVECDNEAFFIERVVEGVFSDGHIEFFFEYYPILCPKTQRENEMCNTPCQELLTSAWAKFV